MLLSSRVVAEPITGVQDRHINLSAPGVWDAIYEQFKGTPVVQVIAGFSGSGPGGFGCPSNAAELSSTTGTH